MLKVGIIGATGYAGNELFRLLQFHREVTIDWLYSRTENGTYSSDYRNFFDVCDLDLTNGELSDLIKKEDVVYSAAPQGFLSKLLTEDILRDTKIIDLSADYRLKNVKTYEEWYKLEHGSPELLKDAVYGLSEIYRDEIRSTRLLANPGCYTTCSILTAWPLVKEHLIETDTLVINALSGVSGAGRGAKKDNLFCELNENAHAYGVTVHRHTPEIEEQLSIAGGSEIRLNFTPHIVPMNRGILVTAIANVKSGIDKETIKSAYEKYYGSEHFIRLLPEGKNPETRFVEGSNYVDIGFVLDQRTGRVVMMGALDNLVKGAAGQAVQNMNLMFGFDESEGINQIPMVP